ncbi:MAG: UDP-2,3-diacylglucosamine diphosphatase [Bacteroidia bacterium]|jgi:UDP-2,3-diacylglucosamine pyrophosphatase LpxH|nr:UDP-2,3-diacylglucosamine diphosphatase [Bacteroidia bacterium]
MAKRKVQVAVISDVHLGTYGCRAKELNQYLKSIDPEILVLNGDIIDIWQFSKRYWPESHMKIVQRVFKLLANGTKVYYLTGNHDELLRKFTDFKMGELEILDKLVLELDGKKAWLFHGDVFDITMKHAKWLAKLGAIGYDTLIFINSLVNWFSENVLRKGKVSLSKKVKNSVKSAVTFIDDFEQTAIDIAIENGYDYVVCGHIHQPSIRQSQTAKGNTLYLNSGDWIENLTALEYHEGSWLLYQHPENHEDTNEEEELRVSLPNMDALYQSIIRMPQVAFNTPSTSIK